MTLEVSSSPTVGRFTCDECRAIANTEPDYWGTVPCLYSNEHLRDMARRIGWTFYGRDLCPSCREAGTINLSAR